VGSLKVLRGRGIVEGRCIAEALVSKKPISFLGGVDPATGKVVEINHDLHGECIKDKVLCFPHGHGSTVGSYVLYSLAKKGLAPKAIVNRWADPVIVVGAVIANIPMIDGVDVSQIKTGELVEVDAYKGIVRFWNPRRRRASGCI
jgi:predicted aconitase with swiveling domain